MNEQTIRADIKLTIFHVDDEPETVFWVGNALFNYFCEEHPNWTSESNFHEKELDGETFVTSFQLNTRKHLIDVHYLVLRTTESFERAFTSPSPHDLVILDVMNETPKGMEAKGAENYEKATKQLAAERVFIMTAYPRHVQDALKGSNPPDEQVLTKPVDATSVIETIAKRLRVVTTA